VGSFGTICWQIFGQLISRFCGQIVGRICGQLVGRFVGQPVGLFWTFVFKPLFTPIWIGVRLIWTTSFHICVDRSEADFFNLFSHLFSRSEVVLLLPLFTPVLTGVKQCYCAGFSISVSFSGQPC
jgi:hypothetical protein